MQLTKHEVVERINRANAAAREGRSREAEGLFLDVIRRRPRDAELLRRLAVVQANLTKYPDALRHIAKAVKLEPRNARLHIAMGWIAAQAGESERSLEAYARAAYFEPGSVEALWGKASVHEKRNELDRAERCVDEALATAPNTAQAAAIKARLQRRRGELDEARALLERAVGAGLPEGEGHDVLFELGRIYDKQGDHEAAFAAIARANAIQAGLIESRAFDADRPFRLLEDYSTIPAERFTAWRDAAQPDDGATPLFLVGMPRSGTTMTEQVLDAHPEVCGSGEASVLPAVKARLSEMFHGEGSDAERLERLSPEQIAELRAVYLDRAREVLKGTGKRILLDKLPLQIMSAPLISRVLPDARVIVALRDPRDVCLSCFFQEFSPNNSMVNFMDLERTARLYAAVMGMYLRQREHYTFPRLEVRYEDTTADPESQARRLLDFVGVSWDGSVLRFYERGGGRFVNTPSYEAVTQPVHRKAVGRWRRYEEHLAPILPTLEPFVEAFGYEPSGANGS